MLVDSLVFLLNGTDIGKGRRRWLVLRSDIEKTLWWPEFKFTGIKINKKLINLCFLKKEIKSLI